LVHSFSDLTLGEVVKALGRYRPLIISAAIVLVALLILPRPDRPLGVATGAAGTISTPRSAQLTGSDAAGNSDAAGVDSSVSPDSSFPAFSNAPADFSPSQSFGSGSSSDSGLAGGSQTTPTTEAFAPAGSTTTTTAAETPLRVVGRTWATRTSGTPVARDGVPADSLPVGTRVQDDKLSFVRLSGTGRTLGLAEHPDGNRVNSGPVAVRACQITVDTWKDGEAIAIAEAPAYDTTNCVAGVRSSGGVWIFDLGGYSDRTDRRGFALVPGAGAGVDFQVAFKL